MSSLVIGLRPPRSVINVGDDKQEWLTLLRLITTHRPAHLHEYTTIFTQVGDVMPVKSFPAMWETATMIMLGKYKQTEAWMEGAGNVPCPEQRRQEKWFLRHETVFLGQKSAVFERFTSTKIRSFRVTKGF